MATVRFNLNVKIRYLRVVRALANSENQEPIMRGCSMEATKSLLLVLRYHKKHFLQGDCLTHTIVGCAQ